MAVDDNDPTTGYPIFLDGGAPDTGVDPTEVAKYAADVGNRIVRATLAELEAYPYARAGLSGHATSTKQDYVHDGSGWRATLSDTGWLTLGTYNTGWSTEGTDIPQYRVLNRVLYLRGRIDATSSAVNVPFTAPLPVGARPSRNTPFMLPETSGSGATRVTQVGADGVITVFKYGAAVNDLALAGVPAIPIG